MCNAGTYPKPGSDEMRKLFRQKEDVVMLNHGAYGLAPNEILDYRIALLQEQEQLPDTWFRVKYEQNYAETISAAARFVGADIDDTFVIDNATTGINTVLKSLRLQPKDEILLTTHSYLAIKNTIDELHQTHGIVPRFLDMPLPIRTEEQIVDMYENFLSENTNIKIAVIDHITSPSAILLPLDKILDVFDKHGVMTAIDGAHGPGQIKLDMKTIKADFYAGNFHKWGYTSRSCAFLWISPKHKGKILPLVTSNCSHLTMHHRFSYMGTRDTSNHFTLPKAVKFYEGIGGLDAMKKHATEIFSWAIPMLCKALGTKPLDIPDTMRAPFMRIIGLPELPEELREFSTDKLIVEFFKKSSIITAFQSFGGNQWLRLSINVYNNKHDVERLSDALVEFYQLKS